MREILKRDGTRQEFVAYKIVDAIKKAFASENKAYDEQVFTNVVQDIFQKSSAITVEDIQDAIEKELFDGGHFEVLKSFTLFRSTAIYIYTSTHTSTHTRMHTRTHARACTHTSSNASKF